MVPTVCLSICHEVMGPYSMIFIFWMLSFKPVYSLCFFTLIKGLFSSSFLSAIRVVSSAYLRLLVFLPAILIPACDSSRQHFAWCTPHIMQPWHAAVRGFTKSQTWLSHWTDWLSLHIILISFYVWVIAEYWAEVPVLHSRSLLIIYFKYSSVCMSMQNSQFITIHPPFLFGNLKFVF